MGAEVPEASKGDIAHVGVKAILSAVPHVGGPLSELFTFVVTPPLEKRRRAWMEEVGQRLQALEQKGIDLQGLQDNQEFLDTVLQATQAALRTSVDEKKTALANAITHSATGADVEGALRHMFLNFIDDFTEWHLRFLVLFADPDAFLKQQGKNTSMSMGGLANLIEIAFPELFGQREFYDQVWADLNARGLVNTPGLHTTMSIHGLMAKRLTKTGEKFLGYIKG